MNIRTLSLFITLAFSCGVSQADCLSYEGRIAVRGVLARATFAGPPNYDSVAAGDRREVHWLVEQQPAVCVSKGPNLEDEAFAAVKRIQLIFSMSDAARIYRTHAKLVGQKVCVSGRLMAGHTGHHYTPVLLLDARFDCEG